MFSLPQRSIKKNNFSHDFCLTIGTNADAEIVSILVRTLAEYRAETIRNSDLVAPIKTAVLAGLVIRDGISFIELDVIFFRFRIFEFNGDSQSWFQYGMDGGLFSESDVD